MIDLFLPIVMSLRLKECLLQNRQSGNYERQQELELKCVELVEGVHAEVVDGEDFEHEVDGGVGIVEVHDYLLDSPEVDQVHEA